MVGTFYFLESFHIDLHSYSVVFKGSHTGSRRNAWYKQFGHTTRCIYDMRMGQSSAISDTHIHSVDQHGK
jgi:hypothetical protein